MPTKWVHFERELVSVQQVVAARLKSGVLQTTTRAPYASRRSRRCMGADGNRWLRRAMLRRGPSADGTSGHLLLAGHFGVAVDLA